MFAITLSFWLSSLEWYSITSAYIHVLPEASAVYPTVWKDRSWRFFGMSHQPPNRTQTGMLSTVRVLRRANHRILSSLKSFKGFSRCASTLKAPEYPSDADRELVNDEYYDIMEDGIANELEEALAEDSPVGLLDVHNV